jgi:hypothetical protein
MASPVEVFLSYAHRDKLLIDELMAHLESLERQGFISSWYDRRISPGTDFAQEIDKYLNTAQIILLGVSQYFIRSRYCYLIEMQQAVERHTRGEATLIPILLRPVYWEKTPFHGLEPLPTNYRPISKWSDRDNAIFEVAEGIRQAAEKLSASIQLAKG